MSDQLIEAFKAQQSDQPDSPEYTVGSSLDGGLRFVGVNRVSTNDQPGGVECGQALTERRYMVTFPDHLTRWVVASLGAYLTDEEWEQAGEDRLNEIEERGEA